MEELDELLELTLVETIDDELLLEELVEMLFIDDEDDEELDELVL